MVSIICCAQSDFAGVQPGVDPDDCLALGRERLGLGVVQLSASVQARGMVFRYTRYRRARSSPAF